MAPNGNECIVLATAEFVRAKEECSGEAMLTSNRVGIAQCTGASHRHGQAIIFTAKETRTKERKRIELKATALPKKRCRAK